MNTGNPWRSQVHSHPWAQLLCLPEVRALKTGHIDRASKRHKKFRLTRAASECRTDASSPHTKVWLQSLPTHCHLDPILPASGCCSGPRRCQSSTDASGHSAPTFMPSIEAESIKMWPLLRFASYISPKGHVLKPLGGSGTCSERSEVTEEYGHLIFLSLSVTLCLTTAQSKEPSDHGLKI
jgi:hypothetical protein